MCLKFYGLDPCHYLSCPGLSWDAMLKLTGVKLGKMSDKKKYLFVENGLNGGISQNDKRYAKANNKYMKNCNPKNPSKFIIYLDINNLYGWPMSEYLPYEGFKLLKNVDGFDVNSISKKSPIRYILEVDLEYPDELHESHSDYPLAPEKLAVPYEMLSDYCKIIADKYGIKIGDVEKLIPNLGNKTNYVLHYRDLQLYLFLGMKLTKIHTVSKFKQLDWMKNYIEFYNEERKNAVNSFEKDFFKLMANSVYGKIKENLRKIIKVRLVTNEKYFLKYTSKPTYISHKIFGKNYAAIHEIKPVIKLNKPIYVGFRTVLKLSKWLMYDFHYNFIKKHFDAKLLLTHTDSLTYVIKSDDVYEELYKPKHLFDFFDKTNKKLLVK